MNGEISSKSDVAVEQHVYRCTHPIAPIGRQKDVLDCLSFPVANEGDRSVWVMVFDATLCYFAWCL